MKNARRVLLTAYVFLILFLIVQGCKHKPVEEELQPTGSKDPDSNPGIRGNACSAVVSWTAYKFPDSAQRVGVTGIFTDVVVNYKTKNPAGIFDYLQDAEMTINTASVNINNDSLRSANTRNYFFRVLHPIIYCKLLKIDAADSTALVNVNLNLISKDILFDIKEQDGSLIFTGTLNDMTEFNTSDALDTLHTICGGYHKNKVWPDVLLKAEIRNYKNFPR